MVGAPRWNRHPVDLFWCCSSTFQTNHFSEVLKPLVPQWKCIRGCTTDSLYRHSQATWPFRPSSGPRCGDFSAHDSVFPWTEALLLKIVGQNYKKFFFITLLPSVDKQGRAIQGTSYERVGQRLEPSMSPILLCFGGPCFHIAVKSAVFEGHVNKGTF